MNKINCSGNGIKINRLELQLELELESTTSESESLYVVGLAAPT